MAYRVVSRFIGIFGLFLWTFPTLMSLWLGIFHRDFLVGLRIGYFLFLTLCILTMFCNFQLLMATEKRINPSSAVELCQLWLLVHSFSLVIWINLLFFIIFVQAKYASIALLCIFVILHGLALYYVNLYEREMSNAIPRTISRRPGLVVPPTSQTEIPIYHIPMMDRTSRTIITNVSLYNKQNSFSHYKKSHRKKNSKDKLPSYEESQDFKITDQNPPNYDTLFPVTESGHK